LHKGRTDKKPGITEPVKLLKSLYELDLSKNKMFLTCKFFIFGSIASVVTLEVLIKKGFYRRG